MQSRSSIIASFLLVSLLVVGGVEFFCRSLGDALSVETKAPLSAAATSTVLSAQKQQIRGPAKVQKPLVTEDYSIITKRGLFGKMTPPKIPIKKADPVSEPLLQQTTLNLTLLGTVSGEGDVQRAIILDKKGKTQDLYYKGDALGTAVIKEVKRGKVILTVGGKDEILLMEEFNSGDAGEKQKPLGPALFTPLPVPKKITRVNTTKPAIDNDGKENKIEKSTGYKSRSVNSVNFQKILNKRKRNK